jgi:GT2 family glycosyltransferase
MSHLSTNKSLGYATSMPGLEIVIVSSTGALELLRSCLRTLRENPYAGGETVVHVVDNASTDGTPEMVRDEFPEVRLHALDWNSGFCVANNIALREVESPYVLVLNPDTEIYPGSLDHMVRLMEGDSTIGMSSCRLEQRDGTLDHASKRSFPTPMSSLYHFIGAGERLGGRFAGYRAPELGERELGEVDAVNGAYMLVRKDAMDEVGLLDEGYWLYMDDLDWCYRFKQADSPRPRPQCGFPPLDGEVLPQVLRRPEPSPRPARLRGDTRQARDLDVPLGDRAAQHRVMTQRKALPYCFS